MDLKIIQKIHHKKGEHIACGCSMSTICAFDDKKSKHDVYRGQDCIKKFYESLKEHAIEIINFKIKKLILSTKKSLNLMLTKTTAAFAKENLKIWI